MNPLDLARAARSATAADNVWNQVEQTIERDGCKCGLERGMGWDDLLPLGSGCTGSKPNATGGVGYTPSYVCPALDQYRRLVGGPPTHAHPEAA